MTDPKPLNNEAEYDAALARISDLMDALSGPEGQETDGIHPDRVELDSLVTRVELYEDEHYPINPPSANEAIEFYIDQFGMSQGIFVAPDCRHGKVAVVTSDRWDWQSSLQPAINSVMRRASTTRTRISTAA